MAETMLAPSLTEIVRGVVAGSGPQRHENAGMFDCAEEEARRMGACSSSKEGPAGDA